ncbi:hypothetical protein KC614_04910, partial [candidate division WWE3 bacterium]|nr:hypothetical protein [candidate division WWE3 bacterium]
GQLLTSDSDFLSVIDTNLSGNKANYWVTRQTAHTIDVDRNGDLKATTTVTWRNDSPGDSWPGGEYINYVRVYVPKGSVVTDVTPQLDDYTVGEMFGYTEVAGVIKVSPQEDKTLTVTYVLPRDLNVSTSSTYELLWQPQPGILDEQVVFTFNVPGFLSTSDAASVTRRIQWPFRINLAFSAK